MNIARMGLFASAALCAAAVAAGGSSAGAQVAYLDQGSEWTRQARAQFYSQDQGSEWMPLAWAQALTLPDGTPFLADQLTRYGYLPNPRSDINPDALPVGFTSATRNGTRQLGMSCAACHTRDISVDGQSYRVDGGPALVDFQAMLTDAMAAYGRILASDAAFRPFALKVLGPDANPAGIAALKAQVSAWYRRENALMSRALPTEGEGWGLGRLDAVGMIFNRLTGLDLGAAPDGIIAANIRPADAPVRYPFIWNAPRQDFTQWPGFAPNGNDLFGLVRNLGEVYGVFGEFRPVAGSRTFDFLKTNSANFHGLRQVENLVWKIGAPAYAWPVDQDLAERGQQLYAANCASCHGIETGKLRSIFHDTWKTKTLAVGTDERQYRIIKWTADPGVLRDAKVYLVGKPLQNPSDSISVLSLAVIGSILQNEIGTSLVHPGKDAAPKLTATAMSSKLAEAYLTAPAPGSVVYESRVMKGIWAAAPYLHNGSVPTLDDLLKPAAERPVSFEVGQVYDKDRLGLAVKQNNGGRYVRTTTGCGDIASGNSRCGHEYGVNLSPTEKKALLEYMKVL